MNFKKKVSGSWVDAPHYLRGTDTDTITSLPTTIYGDGTAATIGLIGNTVQNGTPTPSAPVDVVGVGELETSGEHAGQYKIPILNGSTTTNVYLGEVQTTRKVKKLVLTGEETGWVYEANYSRFTIEVSDFVTIGLRLTPFVSNAFGSVSDGRALADVPDNTIYSSGLATVDIHKVHIKCTTYTSLNDWKAYLQQQYANGTPVTVWYILTSPQTDTVNEPLQKIGSYADSLTTSIPTTDGANTLSVDTTVQPSEVTANYHGWHPVADAHERENGAWT